jgi:hypothetical protein
MKNDTFNGDNAKLVESIKALLALDESGSLVPHGVGGHARQLLSAAASRLSASIADTAPVFRCNDCGGFDIEQVPETMKPESIADTAGAKPVSAEHVTIRRDLLQDLIDDVSDYAVSREFKQRESQWRTQLLESARAALATHAPLSDEPVAWIDKRLLALLPKYYVDVILAGHKVSTDHVPLYTAPQAECAPREAQPVAVMWFEPGSGKPNFAGTGDTVEAGTWERGTKLYAAPTPERADADTAGAKLEGGEWRAIFNSARSPDATFEQFCGWMREEIAATPASSVVDAAWASDAPARTKLCRGSHIMCEGREYCLGEPSCKDLAEKESGND